MQLEANRQQATVIIMDGPQQGQIQSLQLRETMTQQAMPGRVVLVWQKADGTLNHSISEYWRLPGLILLVLILLVCVYMVSGGYGLMSLAGLLFSVCVVALYVVPSILHGANALLVCAGAAFVIGSVSVFIAHGYRKRAVVSVAAVLTVLVVVLMLTWIGDYLGVLTGIYDETSGFLAYGQRQLDLHGVLLGGIVIATLGLLDDVITTQVAAVDELKRANQQLGMQQLFKRAQSVGREHIAALINTLALAYIGVSLPTVLALSSYSHVSVLELLNSEFMAQEVVRTIIASIALVLAVPISTAIAAWAYSRPT
jgi:predicted multitransmembrane protein